MSFFFCLRVLFILLPVWVNIFFRLSAFELFVRSILSSYLSTFLHFLKLLLILSSLLFFNLFFGGRVRTETKDSIRNGENIKGNVS